jgi:hypothetical protein
MFVGSRRRNDARRSLAPGLIREPLSILALVMIALAEDMASGRTHAHAAPGSLVKALAAAIALTVLVWPGLAGSTRQTGTPCPGHTPHEPAASPRPVLFMLLPLLLEDLTRLGCYRGALAPGRPAPGRSYSAQRVLLVKLTLALSHSWPWRCLVRSRAALDSHGAPRDAVHSATRRV